MADHSPQPRPKIGESAAEINQQTAYVPASRASSSEAPERHPFYQRKDELWREHEAIRKGFVADIQAGKTPQETYVAWRDQATDYNRRAGEFNTGWKTDPIAKFERENFHDSWAKAMDLPRLRTWATDMLERRSERERQTVEKSANLGMGMGF